MCPDLQILHEHATSNAMPPLTGGDGKTHTDKMLHVLEGVEAITHEYIKTCKITAVQHYLIKSLSTMIRSQVDYEAICDSLSVPPEYGLMAMPR